MLKILIPVDGSDSAQHAVDHVIALFRNGASLHGALLHVTERFGMREHAYRSHAELAAINSDEAQQALAPAAQALEAAGMQSTTHLAEGDAAQQIVEHATRLGCGAIVMGMRGMGVVLGPVAVGSVSAGVLHASGLPVTLVK
jgi:nucleotide-binding universal stress UspA family protein